MKKNKALLVLGLVLCMGGQMLMAQTAPAAEGDSAVAKKPRGTWTTSSTPALKADQSNYQNWSATGISQISMLGTFDGAYRYTAERFTWDNIVNLALGLNWQDLDGDTTQHGFARLESRRKNEDKIDLTSTFSMHLKDPWNLNASANFKTQFYEGYSYKEGDTLLISNFMAPAYLTTSLGFECKKEFWNLSLSFLTGKTTFLLDERVIDNGQLYGVDTTGGCRVYAGLGSYVKFYFKKDIAKNLNLYTRVEVFYDYRKPTYHDRITAQNPDNFGAWPADMIDASNFRKVGYTMLHDTDIDFECKLEYRFSSWLACYAALRLKYDSDFAGTWRFLGNPTSSWQFYQGAGVQIYFNWKTPKTT